MGSDATGETRTAGFRAFFEQEVAPRAADFDREEWIPEALIRELAERGHLGAGLPRDWGGGGLDALSYGALHEAAARASASVAGVLNVHNMASQAVLRWGRPGLRDAWLPPLASGRKLAALAITEPAVGSDAGAVETVAAVADGGYRLDGAKKFITCGQVADVFVVLARCQDRPTAFLVERTARGFHSKPMRGLLGCRGYMLAELELDGLHVPEECRLGKVGFGLSHVVGTSLDAGRYALAWGCVGIGQACLDASLDYTNRRRQFGVLLREHQLIRQMITDMIVDLKAARLLCEDAGRARTARAPSVPMDAMCAKYFASRMLSRVASDAVQIQGAVGCSQESAVERYLRDSKIMEIVEGTTQIHQLVIASHGYRRLARELSAVA